MYERFGSWSDPQTRRVTFGLFVPDNNLDPSQYDGGGLPNVRAVKVVGDFQAIPWDPATASEMAPAPYTDPDDGRTKGTLYSFTTDPLPNAFYEYKYRIEFEAAPARMISDPCSRYGGSQNQNAGIVVDDVQPLAVRELAGPRLPLADLVIYELMIDDFTAGYRRGDEAPLDALKAKIEYLKELGINAVELMPWMAWGNHGPVEHDFSWGYNPFQYFSVAHRYTLDPADPTTKLRYLKEFINLCHDASIQVIMDAVFNHADANPPDRGFPYYWLYRDPADCPYVGNFGGNAFFKDLDYNNRCTEEFILDACRYWIDQFKIDGIRFDYTLGLYKPDDRGRGLPRLLADLRAHLAKVGRPNFALILEHLSDNRYEAINTANTVGATSCWYDNFLLLTRRYIAGRVDNSIMRLLNSSKEFDPGRAPTVYLENHDHGRLLFYRRAEWYRCQPYVIALFTVAGAVMIYNGQEFGEDYFTPDDGPERVRPRPLHWAYLDSEPGQTLLDLYKRLNAMRQAHPALRTGGFYPDSWADWQHEPDPNGYGIDEGKQTVVFHRWGTIDGVLHRYMIALNFSNTDQAIRLPFSADGNWDDVLNGFSVDVAGKRIDGFVVHSNWGNVFHQAV